MQRAIAATEGTKQAGAVARLAFVGKLLLFSVVMLGAIGVSGHLVGDPMTRPPFYIPLWLPTGIGIGVLLVGGLRYWLGIPFWFWGFALFGLIFSTAKGVSLVEAWGFYAGIVGVAVIILGEVFFAYWLVRPHVTVSPGEPLVTRAAIPRLVGSLVFASMIGKLTLVLYFIVTTWTNADSQLIWYFWGKHVLGDVLGMLLVMPLILAFGRWRAERRLSIAGAER